jgi:hypothetical protein
MGCPRSKQYKALSVVNKLPKKESDGKEREGKGREGKVREKEAGKERTILDMGG